jgi:hypothetical protein
MRNSNRKKTIKRGKPNIAKTRKIKRNHKSMSGGDPEIAGAKDTIKYKKLQCSPDPEKKKSFSCFSNEDLLKLKQRWNETHPERIIKTNEPKDIWILLKTFLAKTCDKETCWLEQGFVSKKDSKELMESFAPESPEEWKKNPNEWLSSEDIINVMRQYEKAYKCFEFLGPSPIDYDARKLYGECVWDEICKLNLAEQIKSGKTKIGLIFNTDPHDKPGEHWISMFINIKKGLIYFFDSAGDRIPARLNKLVRNIMHQGKKLSHPIRFKFDQNHPVEHQYGNTECGIYSLYFVIHMLEDKFTGEYLKTHIITDKYVNKFRKIYFNEDL